MAVAYDAGSNFGGGQAGATSKTWAHTCSGSDRILIVFVTLSPGAGALDPTSITYNGVALSKLGSVDGSSSRIGLWYLIGPATGTNNIVVTFASATAWYSWAGSFTGVQTIQNVTSLATFPSTSSSISVPSTSGVGNMVIDGVLYTSNNQGLTAGANQTEFYNFQTNNSQGSSYESSATTNTTMSWTVGANQGWLHIGAELKAGSQVVGPANLKTYNTNVAANIKSIDTNLIANVKSLNTNT